MKTGALALLVLLVGLALAPTAATAGVAGPGSTLIENTVFEHEIEQNITQLTVQVVNEHEARIIGIGIVDDRVNGVVHEFPYDMTVGEADAAATLASIMASIRADTATIPIPPGATSSATEESDVSSEATIVGTPMVETTNHGSTFEEERSREVALSADAVIEGDIDLTLPFGGDFLVTAGTVEITETVITIEIQHITETTTNAVDILDTLTFERRVVIESTTTDPPVDDPDEPSAVDDDPDEDDDDPQTPATPLPVTPPPVLYTPPALPTPSPTEPDATATPTISEPVPTATPTVIPPAPSPAPTEVVLGGGDAATPPAPIDPSPIPQPPAAGTGTRASGGGAGGLVTAAAVLVVGASAVMAVRARRAG